jgi:hypothetical protein
MIQLHFTEFRLSQSTGKWLQTKLDEFNKHDLQRFLHCNFDFNTLYWQSCQKMVHVASYLTSHYPVSRNTTLNLRHSFFMTKLWWMLVTAVIGKVKYGARGRSQERVSHAWYTETCHTRYSMMWWHHQLCANGTVIMKYTRNCGNGTLQHSLSDCLLNV